MMRSLNIIVLLFFSSLNYCDWVFQNLLEYLYRCSTSVVLCNICSMIGMHMWVRVNALIMYRNIKCKLKKLTLLLSHSVTPLNATASCHCKLFLQMPNSNYFFVQWQFFIITNRKHFTHLSFSKFNGKVNLADREMVSYDILL